MQKYETSSFISLVLDDATDSSVTEQGLVYIQMTSEGCYYTQPGGTIGSSDVQDGGTAGAAVILG